jgi:ADP-ribose pyrophosphatase YjhB (NUDIX family)
MLDLGETILEGVRREVAEETGIEVRVRDLIEVFEKISQDATGRTQYHFVVLDYLCEVIRGEGRAGSDASDVAWAAPSDLPAYSLTAAATRVIAKALEMAAASGYSPLPIGSG